MDTLDYAKHKSLRTILDTTSILVTIVSCGLFKMTCRPDRTKHRVDTRIKVTTISHLGDSFRWFGYLMKQRLRLHAIKN